MHIILTGSGLVGAVALDALLKDDHVDRITIISRRPVPQADGHPSVTVLLQEDLAVYSDETLSKLKGAKGCIWTVGPPLMSVTKEEYQYAHIDLPVAAAKVFSTLNDKFNFVYVSHDDCHNNKMVFFLDVKARAEERLSLLHHTASKRLPITGRDSATQQAAAEEKAIPSLHIYFIRPMLIDYTKHDEVKPWLKPLTMGKKWSNYVALPLYRFLGLSAMVGDSREMGQGMVDLAVGGGEDLDGVVGASAEGRSLGVVGMRNWCKQGVKHGVTEVIETTAEKPVEKQMAQPPIAVTLVA